MNSLRLESFNETDNYPSIRTPELVPPNSPHELTRPDDVASGFHFQSNSGCSGMVNKYRQNVHTQPIGSIRTATTMPHPQVVATTDPAMVHNVPPAAYALPRQTASWPTMMVNTESSHPNTHMSFVEPQYKQIYAPKPPVNADYQTYETVRNKLMRENGITPETIQETIHRYGVQCLESRSSFFGVMDNIHDDIQGVSLPISEPSYVSSTNSSGAYATAPSDFDTQYRTPSFRYEDLPVSGTNSYYGASGASFRSRSNEIMSVKYPEFENLNARLQTFINWPKSCPDFERVAKAGLYYTGYMDVCRCFCCGLTLLQWNKDDDPFHEHLKNQNGCHFILSLCNQGHLQRSVGGEGANECLPGVDNQSRQRATEGMYMPTGGHVLQPVMYGHSVPNYSNSNRLTRGGNVAIEQTEERNRPQLSMFSGDRGNASGINAAGNVPRGRVTGQQGYPRLFDPKVCKVCGKHEIGVTLLPCGHIICPACVMYDHSGFRNCRICGQRVENTTAYDNSQLLKLA